MMDIITIYTLLMVTAPAIGVEGLPMAAVIGTYAIERECKGDASAIRGKFATVASVGDVQYLCVESELRRNAIKHS